MGGGYWDRNCCPGGGEESSSTSLNVGINCFACASGRAPLQFQVDVANIGNSNCTECVNLNTSYVLTQVGPLQACTWRLIFSPVVCFHNPGLFAGYDSISIAFQPNGLNTDCFGRLGNSSLGTFINYFKQFAGIGRDCLAFDEEDIPWSSGQTNCIASSSTFKITALF